MIKTNLPKTKTFMKPVLNEQCYLIGYEKTTIKICKKEAEEMIKEEKQKHGR